MKRYVVDLVFTISFYTFWVLKFCDRFVTLVWVKSAPGDRERDTPFSLLYFMPTIVEKDSLTWKADAYRLV